MLALTLPPEPGTTAAGRVVGGRSSKASFLRTSAGLPTLPTSPARPRSISGKFPDGGGKWQVSTRGGAQPRWRRDGKELFYLALDGKLMAVTVGASATLIETGAPRELFDTGITGAFLDRRNHYVVTRDGQRFLVNISAEDENSAPITVVLNWRAAPFNGNR